MNEAEKSNRIDELEDLVVSSVIAMLTAARDRNLTVPGSPALVLEAICSTRDRARRIQESLLRTNEQIKTELAQATSEKNDLTGRCRRAETAVVVQKKQIERMERRIRRLKRRLEKAK